MQYKMNNGMISWEDKEGNEIILTNFESRIIREKRYIDGKRRETHYVIEGNTEEDELEEVTVTSDDFAGMKWISNAWGSQAIVFPKMNARELVRTIIQIESSPIIETIYTHTGWVKIDGKNTFISKNSAINEEKRTDDINIEVPLDLECYSLPIDIGKPRDSLLATLGLVKLLPEEIAWSLIGAIFRAPIGKSDFAIHITGRTGTFKSEIAAIVQSHFGECSARKLPASWSSTANALEALAYKAKDVVLIIDDFIPMGTSWQIKSYQKAADQLIRGQGNQSGRARLTDQSKMQETMFPRGIIISTGEDTPEGHSVRGRMLIAELSPGDITTKNLTRSQNKSSIYQYGVADYIQWLASRLNESQKTARNISKEVREKIIGVGHTRTPSMIGELMAGISSMLDWSVDRKMKLDVNDIYNTAQQELVKLANRQNEYLIASDPADQFVSILRSIFAANAGHAKGMHGGIPRKAQLLGWTTIGDPEDLEFKPHGPRLGWVEEKTNTIYLDAAVAYDTIRRHSRGSITITRQTLYKRLREAGMLTKTDSSRQRNTVRVQCENAGRTCLALNVKSITEGES